MENSAIIDPSTGQHLPTISNNDDILHSILQFADDKTLATCLRVSQSFFNIAAPLLYHTISLTTPESYEKVFRGATPYIDVGSAQAGIGANSSSSQATVDMDGTIVHMGRLTFEDESKQHRNISKNDLLSKVRILDISHTPDTLCHLYEDFGQSFINLDTLIISSHCNHPQSNGCPIVKHLNPAKVLVQHCDQRYSFNLDDPGCPIPHDWNPPKLLMVVYERQAWFGLEFSALPPTRPDIARRHSQVMLPSSLTSLIPRISSLVIYLDPFIPSLHTGVTIFEDLFFKDDLSTRNQPVSVPANQVKIHVYGLENATLYRDEMQIINISEDVRKGLKNLFKESLLLDDTNSSFHPALSYDRSDWSEKSTETFDENLLKSLREQYQKVLGAAWKFQSVLESQSQSPEFTGDNEVLPCHGRHP